jgi:flavin reductase (DIM6/NTAB) family NADH-FMN oxidoreductase RutF
MSTPEALKSTVGRALGRVPSGVFILTTRDGDGRTAAMMASWVQQAAFHPPAVSVAIGKDRPIREFVGRGSAFALSILGEHDTPLMKKYARGMDPGADPFQGVNVIETPARQPVLADALAWLEGRVTNVFDFGGDHDLLAAEVTAGDILRAGASFTHLRGNGFHY